MLGRCTCRCYMGLAHKQGKQSIVINCFCHLTKSRFPPRTYFWRQMIYQPLCREGITEKLHRQSVYWTFHNQENTEFQTGLNVAVGVSARTAPLLTLVLCRSGCLVIWPSWVSLILTMRSVSLQAGSDQLQRICLREVTNPMSFISVSQTFTYCCLHLPGRWGQRRTMSLESLFQWGFRWRTQSLWCGATASAGFTTLLWGPRGVY